MVATQPGLFDAVTNRDPPPTARWDWQPAHDHGKRHYRHTYCPECGAVVWALITPGGWLVGECGHRWRTP